MKKFARLCLPVFALLSLSSCALPPREAWRVIRNEGVIPYLSVEMGKRPVPQYVHLPPLPSPRFVKLTPSPKAPGPVAGGGVYVVRPMCLLPANRYLDSGTGARAPVKPAAASAPKPVLHLTTAPVRSSPASMVKPTTRPVAVVPAPAPKPVKPMEAKVAAVTPVKSSSASSTVVAPEKPKTSPSRPAAAKTPAPKPAPVAKTTPPPPLPTKPVPAPGAPAPSPVASELPYGTPVPGRPGLVNSPYAGTYQLVDVTGLSPGQEVKCPYSGKAFRVPSPDQAKNGAKSQSDAPPAPKKTDESKKP
jgi:hypothetical protein